MTLSSRDCPSPKIKQHLEAEAHDNPDVILRPGIGKRMDEKAYQQFRVIAFRSVEKLHPGYAKYCEYYDERIEWPASPYFAKLLREQLDAIEGRHECDASEFFTIEELNATGLKHPFKPSTSWEFDREDQRVKQVLKKSGACPIGGTKGENLDEAIQHVSRVKASGKWTDRFSTVTGVRTQTGPPGEGKVRAIHMVSTSDWIFGVESLGSALSNTDEAIDPSNEIMLFHVPPEMVGKWFEKWQDKVVSWLSWDWTQFDAGVAGQLLEVAARYLIGDYPYVDMEIEWLLNTSIMGPWGTVTRWGAVISGWIGTNVGDSLTNILHFLKVLDSLGLLKYVVCILVNGDDIVIGFSTLITQDNVEKINRRSFMTANTSKVDRGDFIWSSKLIIYVDKTGQVVITRIPPQVWNKMKYPERRKDRLDRWVISMGIASQMEGFVIPGYENPNGNDILRFIAKLDQVDLASATDAELMPAAEIMVSDQSWRGVQTPQEYINWIRNTRYVKKDF